MDFIKTHKFLSLFIAILLISIPLTIFQVFQTQEQRSGAAGEKVAVGFAPQTKSVGVNERLDLTLIVDGKQNDISAVDVKITYPTELLEPVSQTNTLTPVSQGNTAFTALINKVETPGTIHFVGVNPGSDQIEGSAIRVGDLAFTTKALGTATVGFLDIHINASGVREQLLLDTENTIPGTYTVSLSPTPQPTTPTSLSPTPILCTQVNNSWTCPSGYVCNFPIEGGSPPYCTPNTSATPTKTPTPTHTTTPTPTRTPTPSPGPVFCTQELKACPDGITFVGRVGPNCEFAPCPTGGQQTSINVTFALTGIGNNAQLGLNSNPARQNRTVNLAFYNSQNQLVKTFSGTAKYESQSSSYKGTIPLTTLPAGSYIVKARMDNTLWRQIAGIQNIIQGTNTLPATTLIAGDTNGDNVINLTDYTLLLGCIRNVGSCNIPLTSDPGDLLN